MEKCSTPERDCPITSEFLQSFGAMDAKVSEMHQAMFNGNSLSSRINKLEVANGRLIGGLILLSVVAPIVTAIAMKLLGE